MMDSELRALLKDMNTHFSHIECELAELREGIAGYIAAEPSATTAAATRPEPPPARPVVPQAAGVVSEPHAMACARCGQGLRPDAAFCPHCGAQALAPSGAPQPAPPRRAEAPTLPKQAPAAPFVPPEPRPPSPVERRIAAMRQGQSWTEFFANRGLPWIGGTLVVLGTILTFVEASRRGWITPTGRVASGAILAVLLLLTAIALRRRYGSIEGSLAAAGAGVAALYASLFAAVQVYDLIDPALGLPIAVAIAGVGVGFGLAWSSQGLALLGLTGAAVAPALAEQTVSPAGMAFVTLAAAAAGLLWLRRDWLVLLAVVTAVSATEAVAMVAIAAGSSERLAWNTVTQAAIVAIVYWAVYQGLIIARTRTAVSGLVDRLVLAASLGAVAYSAWWASVLYSGQRRGYAFYGVAGLYAGLTLLVGRILSPRRDQVTVAWGGTLFAAAVASAIMFGGPTRVAVFAVGGVLLVELGRRLGEPRLQIGSVAMLGVATGLSLTVATIPNLLAYPPDSLFRNGVIQGDAVLASIIAASVSAGGVVAFAWRFRPVYWWRQSRFQTATFWAAVVAVLYGLTTVVIDAAIWIEPSRAAFRVGHMASTATWAAIALALIVVGFSRHAPDLRKGGLALFGAALLKLLLFDISELADLSRAGSAVAVGLLCLAGGIVYHRLAEREEGEHRNRPGPGGGGPLRPVLPS
ncbi:MAG: DUF2339 domain-containing protein [Solirubrobacteraceae bacterium]